MQTFIENESSYKDFFSSKVWVIIKICVQYLKINHFNFASLFCSVNHNGYLWNLHCLTNKVDLPFSFSLSLCLSKGLVEHTSHLWNLYYWGNNVDLLAHFPFYVDHRSIRLSWERGTGEIEFASKRKFDCSIRLLHNQTVLPLHVCAWHNNVIPLQRI